MAAIEERPTRSGSWGSVVCAALALPGLAAAAEIDTATGNGLIGLRWLSYSDRQPGLKRIEVESPSVQLALPLGERWSLDATATRDAVSGASPRWHTSIASASKMSDNRTAFDAKLTRQGEREGWSVAVATSDEHDYESRALSGEVRWSSEDNNRTWNVGAGYSRDRISSTDNALLAEGRSTRSLGFGVTQVLTRLDVVQASLSLSRGRGFYSDPYKQIDLRPNQRRQSTLLLRWNHHFESLQSTLRSQWRIYDDSFGVKAHSVGFEWVAPLGEKVTLTPSLRYHTQSSASFYYDPVYSFVGAPFPPGFFENPPQFLSADHRLSAFGALTVGLKLAVQWSRQWSSDLKIEQYEQRGSWRIGGRGSPGLDVFKATFLQAGLVYRF